MVNDMSNSFLINYPANDYRAYLRHDDMDMKYGLPDKKKYPMPDRDHVMSAIKFFNYVSPSDEKELARNILKRIREYGIEGINVGETNRFHKYYTQEDHLQHHGVAGQKWGQKNGPPYPLKPNEHSAAEKKAGWRKSLENDGSDSNRKRIAKDSSKYLNQIDKKNAFNKRYYDDKVDEIAGLKKYGSKLDKKYSQATTDYQKQIIKGKIDVNNQKLKSANDAGKKLMKDIAANQKAADDIQSYLKANGYNVNAKLTLRNVNTTGEKAANAGMILLATAMGMPGIVRTRSQYGIKYKVKDRS